MSIQKIDNVTRRNFIGGVFSASALVIAADLLPQAAWADTAEYHGKAASAALKPSLYLGLEPDGTVYIVTHRSEMGTGIRTTLPLIAADEMEADWSKVKIEQAIGDATYGDQNTDGSKSIRGFFVPFRQAGAAARLMLTQAAAAQWKVPVSECSAMNHEVTHQPSGKKLGYGALAVAAGKLPAPKPEDLKLKSRSEWRYIGHNAKDPKSIADLKDITSGKAIFGMDAKVPNMVYASVERPPVMGGKVQSFDDKAALQVKGVSQTVSIPPFQAPYTFQPLGGVAVVANSTWAAFQGRKQLKVEWNNGEHASHDSERYKAELLDTAKKPGKVVRNVGDVDAAFAKGGKIVEASYYVPLLAHATMEPPVAIAEFKNGKVEAWVPTQNPQAVQDTVAKALGIKVEDVTCHVTLLGGGFGRKSKPDYVAEAALISKSVGKPVKVVWTREDDIKFDYYHAVAGMYHKASMDDKGKVTGWLHRSVFPSISSMNDEKALYGFNVEYGMGLNDMPFDIPNHRAENGPAKAHVRIGWLRSVANIYHVFSGLSFADELAHAAGRDSLEYQLELLGSGKILDLKPQLNGQEYWNYGEKIEQYPFDTRRLRKVLEIAGEKSGWGKRKPGNGWGMGVAFARSFTSYVASVVEVEVDKAGKIRIPKTYMVVDAGTVVNPERAVSQFEGAAAFGASIALTGEISLADGRVRQSNFHDYPVARINQAPIQTDVHIVESEELPGGIGEPGVPPFVPAFANAVFAATGKRVRELPFSKAKLV
ncbi:MAG: aerobic-type carbon monoxide dehydrogenase, large subunit-like protein [Bryobacterales bacterium]|nr:aerobic-type carbon monoxide dehydrogenase, large subunit-like protein [Bryobacterales bacterium]